LSGQTSVIIILSVIYAVYAAVSYVKKPVVIKKRLWLPGWRVVYADNKKYKNADGGSGKLLKSEKYFLQGKPDLIYKKNNRYIPVELKSATVKKHGRPRESDVMQLAAYFMIIGETYGANIKYGYIVYDDCVFLVRNTRRLKKNLLTVICEMRKMLKTGSGTAEPDFVTCKNCVCRGTVCKWSR